MNDYKPMRKCIVCRQSKPKEELDRYIKTPNGLMLDESGKAQGRGSYICKDEACRKLAVKKKLISEVINGR